MNIALIVSVVLTSLAIAAPRNARDWEIGPIIRGKNYSVGMPLRPVPTDQGWYFDFPFNSKSDGHVHAVTFAPESLPGKSRIIVRYRVRAVGQTRFIPQEHPTMPAIVSVYFQRRGDNWSAKGRYAFYRWYAPTHSVREITPGNHEMVVRLDDPTWLAVVGGAQSGENMPSFKAALADPGRIGLVFGSSWSRGHGVYATDSARFELLSFKVE